MSLCILMKSGCSALRSHLLSNIEIKKRKKNFRHICSWVIFKFNKVASKGLFIIPMTITVRYHYTHKDRANKKIPLDVFMVRVFKNFFHNNTFVRMSLIFVFYFATWVNFLFFARHSRNIVRATFLLYTFFMLLLMN